MLNLIIRKTQTQKEMQMKLATEKLLKGQSVSYSYTFLESTEKENLKYIFYLFFVSIVFLNEPLLIYSVKDIERKLGTRTKMLMNMKWKKTMTMKTINVITGIIRTMTRRMRKHRPVLTKSTALNRNDSNLDI